MFFVMEHLHILVDRDCDIYLITEKIQSAKRNTDISIILNKGRHIFTFISNKYGCAVYNRVIHEVYNSDDSVDFIQTGLSEMEYLYNEMSNNNIIKDNSAKDKQGNIYSNDYTILIKASHDAIVELDDRCQIISPDAFTY